MLSHKFPDAYLHWFTARAVLGEPGAWSPHLGLYWIDHMARPGAGLPGQMEQFNPVFIWCDYQALKGLSGLFHSFSL